MKVLVTQRGHSMVWAYIGMCTLLIVSARQDVHRERRNTGQARYCKKKFQQMKDHTACLPSSPNLRLSVPVSGSDQALIVNLHNTFRSQVSPPAANMLKMRWDDELAEIAQAWADNCLNEHDQPTQRLIPGRFSVGQNLAWLYKDWETAITAWHNEVRLFTFGDQTQSFPERGHYTQMVWGLSSRIGCGYSECANHLDKFYVCNYGPTGNNNDWSTPYLLGAPQCGSAHLKNNLCECDKDCLNGGTLDLSDCTCSCLKSFYTGDQCDLDCGKVEDGQPSYCGSSGFDVAGCTTYENVPYHCPQTCSYCPWAGINYQEPQTTPVPGQGLASALIPNLVLLGLAVALVLLKYAQDKGSA